MAAVLTEGGVVESQGPSSVKYWGIEFAQKHFGRIEFCGSDRERLELLRNLIWETGKSEPRPGISAPVARFLESYAGTRGLESHQRLLADPAALVGNAGRFRSLTPFMQSLFRDEAVPAQVATEPDGSFRLLVAIHLLPDSELHAVVDELLPEWKRFAITASEPFEVATRTVSPLDHPVFRGLVEAVRTRASRGRGRPLFPALDRHRLALLPHGRHSELRLLPLPHLGHRHPADRRAQRTDAAAGLRRGSAALPRDGAPSRRLTFLTARTDNCCRSPSAINPKLLIRIGLPAWHPSCCRVDSKLPAEGTVGRTQRRRMNDPASPES